MSRGQRLTDVQHHPHSIHYHEGNLPPPTFNNLLRKFYEDIIESIWANFPGYDKLVWLGVLMEFKFFKLVFALSAMITRERGWRWFSAKGR